MNTTTQPDSKVEAQDYGSSLFRKCSNCGRTGHNSRTCLETRADPVADSVAGVAKPKGVEGESNQGSNKARGEASVISGTQQPRQKEARKKGVAWTEEEHKQFLAGLQKLGKGNWRGISRHFVQSKSPTQVASHAQKYFIRQTIAGKRKRRSSLFDLVPDEADEQEGKYKKTFSSSSTSPGDETEEVQCTTKGAGNGGAQVQMPAGMPIPGPEAFAWAYWYQMMMQQNPMSWVPGMFGGMPPGEAVQGALFAGQNGFPAMMPPSGPSGVPNPAANPAMAFWAQQQQMAAAMAMNFMPFSPDHMAQLFSQAHASGMPKMPQPAEPAPPAAKPSEGEEPEASAGQPQFTAQDVKLETTAAQPSTMNTASSTRVEGSNTTRDSDTPENEHFGQGALIRPTAHKAGLWNSLGEMPSYMTDETEGPSFSKQSHSTQLTNPTSFQTRVEPTDPGLGSGSGNTSSDVGFIATSASDGRSAFLGAKNQDAVK